ncbi:MAG: hypothetical protein V3S14_00940, partial [Anaerolineae bacterium]
NAAWYLGSGTVKYILHGDTTELKKSATEIAGIGAGLIPGCKAGASFAMKVGKEVLSVAASYLAGKGTEMLLNSKWHPSQPPTSSGGYSPGLVK